MVSKRPWAIAVLVWMCVSVVLEVVGRLNVLPSGIAWYVFYYVSPAVTALLYLALWRVTAGSPGSRLLVVASALEGIAALIGVVTFAVPALLPYLALPAPLPAAGLFDVLSLATAALVFVAVLRTRVAPPWVAVLRLGTIASIVALDALVPGAGASSSGSTLVVATAVSYASSALSFAFWTSLAVTMLLRERAADAAPSVPVERPSMVLHMVAIAVVMLLLVAGFPFLVIGTVYIFHVPDVTLAIVLSVAALAYGVLWAVGSSLDARYRRLVAGASDDATVRPAIPRMVTDAYGMLLVCLLPFLVYLFVLALYGVELFATELLILMDSIQVVPVVVVGGLLLVAGGSVWGVVQGVWRLFVPVKSTPKGVELARGENARLWELVDAVARDAGTRPVDRMWASPDAGIAVWEQGGLWRVLSGRAPRCMSIGLTAVHDMSVPELRAVLRHEFAHFGNRDTVWGSFTFSMSSALLAAWRATPGGNPARARSVMAVVICLNPAWWVYWLFVRLFFRSTAGFSRLREMEADWDAIDYAGGACFASGLTRVIVSDHALQAWLRDTKIDRSAVPGVAESVAAAIAGMSAEQLAEVRGSALSRGTRTTGVYDTHPVPQARVDYALRGAAAAAASCDGDPVRDLVDSWGELDAQASQAWLAPA